MFASIIAILHCDSPLFFILLVPSLIAPSPPLNLEAVGISPFALNITWDPPLDNGGRPVIEYVIIVDTITVVVEGNLTNAIIENAEILVDNVTYEYGIEM